MGQKKLEESKNGKQAKCQIDSSDYEDYNDDEEKNNLVIETSRDNKSEEETPASPPAEATHPANSTSRLQEEVAKFLQTTTLIEETRSIDSASESETLGLIYLYLKLNTGSFFKA